MAFGRGKTHMTVMKAPGVILIAVGLTAIFGFMGWSLLRMGGLQGITGGSTSLTIMVALGVLGTALLAGVLMRLAFWSSRKGYDETVRFEQKEPSDEA